ncbi:MAG: FAD-binding protein [Caldisericia bacterium]|nr:FAD-binding protein [Caldisericia bacterium]
MKETTTNFFDVIIIGTGISGLYTAYHIDPSKKVLLISKESVKNCNTRKAKGGMAAALYGPDNPSSHLEDTMKAGGYLNSEKAVDVLTKEVVDRIHELANDGFVFDKDPTSGHYNMGLEGCHSHRRVLHSQGDRMGVAIFNFLYEKVESLPNTTFLEHTELTDIITEDNTLQGIQIHSSQLGETNLYCHSLAIASGGYSGIYKRNTSDKSFFGNVLTIAYKAGIGLTDLEFIQFHPTVFVKEDFETLLMSEAIRGEGAILLNPHHESFMHRYHPDAELASRDIVSQSMWKESLRCKSQDFYLDLRPIGKETILRLFPEVYDNCLLRGIDIIQNVVPVFPGAHYSMGGIYVDLFGKTNVKGIYAIGECSCNGTHGANRLASNSLIDSLVFGKRTAQAINDQPALHLSLENTIKASPATIVPTPFSKTQIQQMNWDFLGIMRNQDQLEHYLSLLQPYMEDNYWYSTAKENGIDACQLSYLLSCSALLRKESRGAHFRTDYPEENPMYSHSFLLQKSSDSFFPTVQKINYKEEK